MAQGQARRADPRRRRPQHLRADDRRALRGARAAGRAGGDAGDLGRGRRPVARAARRSRCGRWASGWPGAAIRGRTCADQRGARCRGSSLSRRRTRPSRDVGTWGSSTRPRSSPSRRRPSSTRCRSRSTAAGSPRRGAQRARSTQYDKHGGRSRRSEAAPATSPARPVRPATARPAPALPLPTPPAVRGRRAAPPPELRRSGPPAPVEAPPPPPPRPACRRPAARLPHGRRRGARDAGRARPEEDRNRRVRAAEAHRRGPAGGLTAARAILSAMRPYEGLLTAMVTPFRADGSVDEEGAVAIGRHLLANGSHGLGRGRHHGRGGDDDRRGAPRPHRADRRASSGTRASSSAARAPTTRATPIHLTEKAVEAGRGRGAVGHAVLQQAEPARDHRPLHARSPKAAGTRR